MITEEKNKLIAEFMGKDIGHGNMVINPIQGKNWTVMKYNSSLDWLFPVIIECFNKYCEIQDKDVSVFSADNRQFLLNDALLTLEKEKVFDAIIDFIQWYNENK